jgi:hypothetical protein
MPSEAYKEFWDYVVQTVWTILAGSIGGVMVAFLSHILAKDRDRKRDRETSARLAEGARKQRLKCFLAFLAGWKAEIGTYPTNWPDFNAAYRDNIPKVREAAALMRGDFNDETPLKFDALVDAACSFESKHFDKPEIKVQKIQEAIDAIGSLIR